MSGPEPGGVSRGGQHNSTMSTSTTKKDGEKRRASSAGHEVTKGNSSKKGTFDGRSSEDGTPYETPQADERSRRKHSKPPSRSSKSSYDPPVTKATLSELDVNKIVHNPKLRHDINFDPELHFRPNLDGEKGRRKTQKANEFWDTMKRQLELFLVDREAFEREVGTGNWCLPATLGAIKGILETLVPSRDRPAVEEIFNVDLLMQQFSKGVANLEKMAQWLSLLLKSHCAPMRDDWVDQMVAELSNGEKQRDVAMLVSGMRTLLGVLEAMKLDVANHQIRCLRPLLIDDTVHFEQKFFARRIELSKFNTKPATTWFRRAKNEDSSETSEDMWIFFNAVVDLILPSKAASSKERPETFVFDEERIVKLRADFLDAVNLEVCDRLFKALDAEARMTLTRSASPLTSSSFSSNVDLDLSSPMVPGFSDFGSSLARRMVEPDLRRTIVPEALSRTPSPDSSASSSGSPYCSTPSTPLFSATATQAPAVSSESLHQNILAILEDSSESSESRWQAQAGSIALQILRSTTAPLSHAHLFEARLERHISNPGSRLFQECEGYVLKQVMPMLKKVVTSFVPLSALQVFEAATSPKNASFSSSTSLNSIHDMATRLAHIGVLHWRVWAQLAYLSSSGEEEGRENMEGTESNVPVADEGDPMEIDSEPSKKHPQQRQGSITEIPTRSS